MFETLTSKNIKLHFSVYVHIRCTDRTYNMLMMLEAYFDPFPRSKENIYWNKKIIFKLVLLFNHT